jgi:hypothetical protein
VFQDAAVQDAAEGDMSLGEAEARMMEPPSEDELKENSERREASTKARKLRKHVQLGKFGAERRALPPLRLSAPFMSLLARIAQHLGRPAAETERT